MMNRRYFFQSAITAAAALRHARAASDRVNLAIIGVRGRGRALASGFAKRADANIEYLCDVDQSVIAAATQAVEKEGKKAPKILSDMRRVWDDKSIDAVVIATPDHWHAPAAIMACDAGKDVYLEKPCAHNAREGRLIVDAARRNQRIVQHGTQARSREITRQAIDYVHSGKLGKVLMAKAWNVQKRDYIGHKNDAPVPAGLDYDTWVGAAPFRPYNENRLHYKWHWNWNFGTGDIGNDGTHQIDMARWALDAGLPTEVAGSARKLFFDDDQQTPDTMNLTFSYPGKQIIFEMRIWNSYGMEGAENGVAVYGADGTLQIAKWDRVWGYKVFDAKGKQVLHEERAGEDEDHLHNFLECVRSRKAPNAEIEIGHQTVLHCHLGNIVARTGRNVRFDAATESVTGDAEANRFLRREYRDHWSKPKGV